MNSARQLFSNLGAAIAVPLMTAVLVNTFSHDMHGITDVFTIGIGFAAAAFLLTLVFPHIELTTWEGER